MEENITPRADGRAADELRKITFKTGIAPNASGSVLVSFGNTQVICAACIEAKVPCFHLQGSDAGPLVKVFSFHSLNLNPYIPLITSFYAEVGRERINFHVPHGIYYYIMYYERLG